MTKRTIGVVLCSLAFCLFVPCVAGAATVDTALAWSALPPLPPAPGQTKQMGLAGPFVGTHGDVLIVAGGANFPNTLPWYGGKKVWWDDIYVLRETADGQAEWLTDKRFKLSRPLAYGVAISTDDGIVCIGGCDAKQSYADVFLLRWNASAGNIETQALPPLPRPLSFMGGANIGTVVYVVGGKSDAGATTTFLALDLAKRGDKDAFVWKELPACPGPPRILPIVAAQSNGSTDCLYVLSGRNVQPGRPTELLTDAYSFDPKAHAAAESPDSRKLAWKRLADVGTSPTSKDGPAKQQPVCVMAGVGIAAGANHVMVFGGADGKLFLQLEQLDRNIAKAKTAGDNATIDELTAKKTRILDSHPGFSRNILAYHTITDTWATVGELPEASPVTTAAVRWDGAFVIPSGEIRPGVRTPKVWRADPPATHEFGLANYLVLSVYLAALVGMGVYFSRREKSTDDFFKAGGRIPWWAAGLSIFGTSLSAITFMAIPCKTYATDWRYFMANMAQITAAPVVIALYLPFYRRLNVTTAYEYLEKRFNVVARLLGSTMFLMFQLGRIGIVLYLPSIALSIVTGIDVYTCIIVMGTLSVVYTVLGGIEAVIWTDVLQVVVLMGGAILSLVIIAFNVDGGFAGMISMATADHKLHTFDLSPSVIAPTLWVVFLGGLCQNIIASGSDQTVVQRYLTTKDEKSAARGLWTSALMTIPASFLFFGVGTALYVFYKTHPQFLSPTMTNADAIFPWYIVTQLPSGVAGIVIAGLFAAAMSSLDSSMNSSATAITTDFYRRFNKDADDHTCLNLARWMTVIVGVAGTSFAMWMAASGGEIKSLWDEFSKVIGLLAGGLSGLFLLGIISKRAHGVGAIVGLLGSGLVQYWVSQAKPVHLLLFTFTGIMSCLIIGYVASLIIPVRRKPIEGLTIYTIDKIHEA